MKHGRLRIFHTVCHDQWGGLERRVFHECRWMAENGHDIFIAAPPASPLSRRASAEGWTVFDFPFRKRGMAGDAWRLRKTVRRISPHVFNTHGNTDTKVGLTAVRGLNLPCIVLSRHITPSVSRSWYNRLFYGEWSDYILTTGQYAARRIQEDFDLPADKVHSIPSGITPPHRLPDKAEAKAVIARELGIPEKADLIGYVGRLSEDKGLGVLMEAFHRVLPRFPNTCLVFIGDGGYLEALKQQAESLQLEDRVRFAGFRENPWPWRPALAVSVLPSLENEGIPQALLEAMYAGSPVIGTRVGGIPEVVMDGETGLLSPPNDGDRLARKMAAILADPESAKHRAEKARQMVADRFTIESMGRRILALYEKVLTGGERKGAFGHPSPPLSFTAPGTVRESRPPKPRRPPVP